MLRIIKKNWLAYLFELIIAVIFMSFGIEVFLVYAFLALLIAMDIKIDYLRKLMRVYSISSEAKILAIARKQKIKDEQFLEIGMEMRNSLSEKQIQDLNDDISSVSGNP